VKIVQLNNLEWKYVPNTTRLVTDGFHREDIVQAIPTKKVKNSFFSCALKFFKHTSRDLGTKIRNEFKRIERFQVRTY